MKDKTCPKTKKKTGLGNLSWSIALIAEIVLLVVFLIFELAVPALLVLIAICATVGVWSFGGYKRKDTKILHIATFAAFVAVLLLNIFCDWRPVLFAHLLLTLALTVAALLIWLRIESGVVFAEDAPLTGKRKKIGREKFSPIGIGVLVHWLLCLMSVDVTFLEENKMLLTGLLVGVPIFTIACTLLCTVWKGVLQRNAPATGSKIGVIFLLLCASFCVGYTSTLVLDLAFDDGAPQTYECTVSDKKSYSSGKSGKHYEICVSFGEYENLDIEIGSKEYDEIEIGDTVCVNVYEGGLGFSYVLVDIP